MCDTIVALPGNTAKKITLFGKNSDRERSEAQAVELFSAADHEPEAQVACTYITIPQVRRTHAMLLCRPFWMWGAEIGANEYGVVIGNEAVFARTPPQEEKALLGMDLLRLALERATTAAEALDVIINLLERYGQGGNCSQALQSFYHNSFIIAGPTEAFVLETMGRHWLVEQVRGVRAISNIYSIGLDPARVSSGFDKLVRDNGWSDDAVLDYADAITYREHDSSGRVRCSRSTSLLHQRDGELTAADMIRILRDHGPEAETDANWRPQHSVAPTICAHATDLKPRGQTVGSLVSELDKTGAVHWVTGSAVPCASIFKPVLVGVPLPSRGPKLTEHVDLNTLWWRHERLHHAMLGSSGMDLASIHAERDALEADMRGSVAAVLNGGNADDRARVVAGCWRDAMAMEDRWLAQMFPESG